MKKLFKILILALLIFPIASLASHGEEIVPLLPASYLFHLYYDNDQLFADRDFEFKYDVAPEEYKPGPVTTQFPFRGEITNFLNQVAATFQFDPRGGNPNFLKGKISVKSPYVPDGQKVIFYDSQGRALLTVFVSESSFCNDDGVCNFERGEDEKTCPNDCRGITPPSSADDQSAGGQTDMLKTALYVLIMAGAALGGWFGWRRYKRRQEPPLAEIPPSRILNKPNI